MLILLKIQNLLNVLLNQSNQNLLKFQNNLKAPGSP